VSLSVENLSVSRSAGVFRREHRHIVGPLNFTVQQGTAAALVGPNGSGKTTFLHALHGLVDHSGTATFNGQPLSHATLQGKVGMVWQETALPFATSSRRWVSHLSRLYATPTNDKLLEFLEIPLNRRPMRSLSGGEKQRIALYSALFFNPALIVLDEPTTALDEPTRAKFYTTMRQHLDRGATVLFSSHYAHDVTVLADQVIDLAGARSETMALFTTDAIVDVFAAAALIPEGGQLLSTNQGYRLKGLPVGEMMTTAMKVCHSQNITLLSFSVIGNE
jgi:ABC-type multidrug transport system ATPase subunit